MRRTRSAVPIAALLAAVLPAAGAAAAPGASAPPGAAAASVAAAAAPTQVSVPLEPEDRLLPEPREVALGGAAVAVPEEVSLVVAGDVDERVVAEAREVLAGLGVDEVHDVELGETPTTDLVVAIADDPSAEATAALAALGTTPLDPASAGGYALAIGPLGPVQAAVVAGVDAAGAFAGLQTLRQLATVGDAGTTLAAGTVRDWPEFGLRGVIEGFYGEPWSHEDRLTVIDFLGDVKGNSYIYAPKDDPYHLAQWRDPYPAAELAQLTELVAAADAELVELVFTISPGEDICYSDPDDVEALLEKMDSMWDIGVRQFGVFFDDIDLELNCDADVDAYADAASPAAAAQIDLLATVQTEFVEARPEALPLMTVPTEYSGTGESDYKTVFAAGVPDDVVVYWTGPSVVSDTITTEQAEEAVSLWDNPLAIWDNYPVNDFAEARLFMGPLIGRDAGVADLGVVGFSANPMNQARASEVPLATVHDYLWNPDAYDPNASWDAALELVGGATVDALRTFAENNYSSDIGHPANPVLSGLVEAFTSAWGDGDDTTAAADALVAYFEQMAAVPGDLAAGMDPAFVEEVAPWIDKVGAFGEAGAAAVRSLLADVAEQETEAWQQRQLLEDASARATAIQVETAGRPVTDFLEWARDTSRLVVLTAPSAGETVDAGADVVVGADVRSGDVTVDEVAFYAGTELLGVDDSAPFELTWNDVPEGMPSLYAIAVDATGTEVNSAIVRITVGEPEPVLFIVGNPEGMAQADVEGDLATIERLEFLGYPVETSIGTETTVEDTAGKAAIVVSESIGSADIADRFRDTPVPFGVWEQFVFDDMGMAGEPNLEFNATDVDVVGPDHPVAAGLSGTVRVYEREGIIGFGTPSDDAHVIATVAGNPELATVFAYDAGDAMIGLDAPARRLGLPYVDDAVGVLTPEGQVMFDAAMRWLIEGEVEPTPDPTEEPTEEPTTPTQEPTTPTQEPTTAPGTTPPGTTPPGSLPDTGAPLGGLVLLAALVLLGGCGALAARRRGAHAG